MTPPSRPGWYWLKDGEGSCVVSVGYGPGVALGVMVAERAPGWARQTWTRLDEFEGMRWAGPLEPPA